MAHFCPACREVAGCTCGLDKKCAIQGHPLPHMLRPEPKSIDKAIFDQFMRQPDGRSGELQ